MPATVTFTRYTDVVEVLGDKRFQVPAMPPAGLDVDLRWLRSAVSRFSNGDVHDYRRYLCQVELDQLAPGLLRARAAELARTLPADEIAVEVLAVALGIATRVYEPVAQAAAGYLPGTDAGPRGDDAVRHLVNLLGGVPDEATAAKIALLVQACNATAALIANTLKIWQTLSSGGAAHNADCFVAETLRFDPPIRAMRRVCVKAATVNGQRVAPDDAVVLDIAAANRDPAVFAEPNRFHPGRADMHLTFGAGVRPCPGRDHAFAIASGVVEAIIENEMIAATAIIPVDAKEQP